jgi:Domain of unknown function (DUF1707)/Domain of unknown function (DUF4190)
MVADGYEHMRAAAPDGYGHMAASGPDGYGPTQPPAAAPGYGHMQPSARDWYGHTQPPAAPGYGPPAAPGYGHTQPPAPDWYGQMQPPAAGYGHMRAATADRERAIDVLKAAYAEGRLTADEYQERVGQVYASRTYAELGLLTADLPIGPLGTMVPPRPAQLIVPVRRPVNSLAVVSLICALIPGLPSAAAVVTGVVARSQIRETGERGAGMAAAGIAIGGFVLVLFLLFLVAA